MDFTRGFPRLELYPGGCAANELAVPGKQKNTFTNLATLSAFALLVVVSQLPIGSVTRSRHHVRTRGVNWSYLWSNCTVESQCLLCFDNHCPFNVGLVISHQSLLPHPHAIELPCAPKLSCAEDDMEDGCDDLEGRRPPTPKREEEPRDNASLNHGAGTRGDAGRPEDAAQKRVVVRSDAIQDDGDVRPQLGDNVKHSYETGSV